MAYHLILHSKAISVIVILSVSTFLSEKRIKITSTAENCADWGHDPESDKGLLIIQSC